MPSTMTPADVIAAVDAHLRAQLASDRQVAEALGSDAGTWRRTRARGGWDAAIKVATRAGATLTFAPDGVRLTWPEPVLGRALTDQDVTLIRRRARAGEMYGALAAEYGVTFQAVWQAARGVTWAEHPEPVASARRSDVAIAG